MSGVDPRERVQARSGSTGPVEPGAGAAVSPGDSSVAAALPTDRLGRTLRDLRISVTDRCNFRCTYCMPKEVFGRDYEFLPRSELLSFDELERLTRVFVALGVSKVRLTGGEPLVRRDLERLVAKLSAIEGLDDLTLTTNGSLLDAKAAALRAAGLRRLTVSLDSLDDHVFARLNDVDFPVARVLAGIEAAEAAGFRPIKINMVVRRGVNEESIVPMARYFRERGHILRFIEYMDVGHTNGWRLDEVVPAAEVIARVDAEMPLEPEPPNYPGEVATRWRYRDGGGEVGMISSVTQPFCGSCTRARITADGKLWTCLFATTGHDLRALLRSGATEEEIRQDIDRVWRGRTDRYSEIRGLLTIPLAPTGTPPRVEMSHIGG